MKPSEVLKAARKLIERPEAWTKFTYWRDARGLACNADEATCYCAVGALIHVADGDRDLIAARRYLERDEVLHGESSIGAWNDKMTTHHVDVLAGFSRAIELAEKEEAANAR